MKRQEEEWASLVADFIDQWNASSMEEEEGTSEIIIRFYHNININIFFRFSQQISCAIFIYLFREPLFVPPFLLAVPPLFASCTPPLLLSVPPPPD